MLRRVLLSHSFVWRVSLSDHQSVTFLCADTDVSEECAIVFRNEMARLCVQVTSKVVMGHNPVQTSGNEMDKKNGLYEGHTGISS